MESAITVIIFLVDDSVSRGLPLQFVRGKGARWGDRTRTAGGALASIYRKLHRTEEESILINMERDLENPTS